MILTQIKSLLETRLAMMAHRCSLIKVAMAMLAARVATKSTAEVAAVKWLMIAVTTVGLCTPAWAQDINVGKTEYQFSCAACHGIDAKGNGPVSKELKNPPADLTVLAKNNNGVFPYDTVYQMIDGRNTTIASHGTREMPIWGYRFGPRQAFRFKNRILSVIDYLQHIQER